jgi:hypothetical protein
MTSRCPNGPEVSGRNRDRCVNTPQEGEESAMSRLEGTVNSSPGPPGVRAAATPYCWPRRAPPSSPSTSFRRSTRSPTPWRPRKTWRRRLTRSRPSTAESSPAGVDVRDYDALNAALDDGVAQLVRLDIVAAARTGIAGLLQFAERLALRATPSPAVLSLAASRGSADLVVGQAAAPAVTPGRVTASTASGLLLVTTEARRR